MKCSHILKRKIILNTEWKTENGYVCEKCGKTFSIEEKKPVKKVGIKSIYKNGLVNG